MIILIKTGRPDRKYTTRSNATRRRRSPIIDERQTPTGSGHENGVEIHYTNVYIQTLYYTYCMIKNIVKYISFVWQKKKKKKIRLTYYIEPCGTRRVVVITETPTFTRELRTDI